MFRFRNGVKRYGKPIKLVLTGILVVTGLSACVTSRVEEFRQEATNIQIDEGLVVLGRASYNDRQTKSDFTECVSDVLLSTPSNIRLINENEFKDKLYPWFEPRTAPTNAEQLTALFSQPGVRAQIRSQQVRYLAWVDGDTVTTDQGGSFSCSISTFGAGCFGISYWEEDASYQASIWDLENLTSAGEISADANGTSYLAGLVVPIPIISRPGNAACKALGRQLSEFLITGADTPG